MGIYTLLPIDYAHHRRLEQEVVMQRSKFFTAIMAIIVFVPILTGCAKKDTHWGQQLDPDKSWWKKEGQSWDRKTNVFMAIGYSNPDWTDKYDLRKSADLDARSQVASFMNSLVNNYMEEIRSRNFTISESVVEASARETVTGSVVVARHYKKRGKYKGYRSLIKVDLTHFFHRVEKQYSDEMANDIRAKHRRLDAQQLDALITQKTEESLAALQDAEAPAVEKSLKKP